MPNNYGPTIKVASDEQLRCPSYRARLKIAVWNVDIGQRDWPTRIQHSMMKADMRGVTFLWPCGADWPIPLVDDVWQDERYVRRFLANQFCEYPEKDRLIDLFFRIELSDLARHFGR